MKREPVILTNYLRKWTSGIVTPIGVALKNMGVSPDLITVLGLVVVAIGSWRIAEGEWTQGAIILILGLPLDTLDGAVARAYGKFRPFGSFLDSTLDRYADALIFGGIALYYADQNRLWLTAAAVVALHGAMTVSYIRAKAESIDVDCKVGLFTRVERLLTLLIAWLASLFVGTDAIDAGVIILALGTQVTSLQRMVYVRRILAEREREEPS
jgi:CDP-diacylglycerol--glycerol-3-phosphate 3-phosphatidyltransferase